MITKEKIEVYIKMGGEIDHLQRIGTSFEKSLFQGNDWYRIDRFVEDIELINKDLVSSTYKVEVLARLEKETDNTETIEEIKKLIGNY